MKIHEKITLYVFSLALVAFITWMPWQMRQDKINGRATSAWLTACITVGSPGGEVWDCVAGEAGQPILQSTRRNLRMSDVPAGAVQVGKRYRIIGREDLRQEEIRRLAEQGQLSYRHFIQIVPTD